MACRYVPKGSKFHGKSLVPFYTGATNSHREWLYGYAATSQLLRTKNYILEVVNSIMNMARGRFYYTGENRFGYGYELADGIEEHSEMRKKFDDILKALPAMTKQNGLLKGKMEGNLPLTSPWLTSTKIKWDLRC